MKTKGQPWSFRAKFLLSTSIATLVLPTIAAVIFFRGELSSTKEFILNDSVTFAENIAQSIYVPLVFDDLASAKEEIEGVTKNPQINSICIWIQNDEDKKNGKALELFYSSRKENTEPAPDSFSLSEIWLDSVLRIIRPIRSDGESKLIGWVVLDRSLSHLVYKKEKLKQVALTSWIFIIIAILFVIVWYQNSLTRPLKELTRVAEKISNEKNYNLRAKKMSMDEFGKLTDLFNDMLDSINETNQQLLVAHQEMEERVEERTKELTLTNEKLLSEIKVRERATQELIETRDRLGKQEKIASFGQVSSNIAHELRNPMAAIRNSTYFLRLKNKGDSKTSHHLEVIDRELSRSDDVIQRLLEITKGETLSKQPTDLRELAKDAMTYSNITGNVNLALSFKPQFFKVNLDRILFRQVLCNLFLNAIQAMPKGGKIALIASKLDNGQVLISVSDQGTGIKQKDIKKVFDPLFTKKKDGVGLGLSLCKELVTRHGGTITAKSEENQGTTIEILLPEENSTTEQPTPVQDSAELTSI